MVTVWLTTGLQGSGKSTWAMEQVEKGGGNVVAISLDDIRNTLGFGSLGPLTWTKELEEVAMNVQDDMIVRAVKMGKEVIVHNTHMTARVPTRIKKLFDGDVLFRVKDFTGVPVADCILRDAKRMDHKQVGSDVIAQTAKHLKKSWRLTEEFMNDVKLSPKYRSRANTPKAIVVDIDGTVARHDHRSPYEYYKLYTDGVHVHIANLVDMYYEKGYTVIFMSGRPDTYRTHTEEWLRDNDIRYDELFMRAADDKRNDSDVKQELFDKYVRDSYRVDAWFDDRNRVVRRMRKLGINVLQVAEGDF